MGKQYSRIFHVTDVSQDYRRGKTVFKNIACVRRKPRLSQWANSIQENCMRQRSAKTIVVGKQYSRILHASDVSKDYSGGQTVVKNIACVSRYPRVL